MHSVAWFAQIDSQTGKEGRMTISRLVWTAVLVAGLATAGCGTSFHGVPIGPRRITVRPYLSPGPPPTVPPPTAPPPQGQPPAVHSGSNGLPSPSPAQQPVQPDPDAINVEAVTSNSIFIEPAAPEERTIFLDMRSGVEEFDQRAFRDFVTDQFKKNDKGYEIIDNPRKAHFYLVANVLNLTSNRPVNPGARQQVVTWVLVCEIQVKELAADNESVTTRTDSKHRNGDNTAVTESAAGRPERKEYRTRITTTARGVDLELQDARG